MHSGFGGDLQVFKRVQAQANLMPLAATPAATPAAAPARDITPAVLRQPSLPGGVKRARSSTGSTLDGFVRPQAHIEQARTHLAQFIFSNNLALRLIECPHLKNALKCLGMAEESQLTRHELAGKQLDSIHASAASHVKATLASGKERGGHVMVASDGWKSGSACSGAPLINIMLLLSWGGAFFHSLTSVQRDQKKTSEWLAKVGCHAAMLCALLADLQLAALTCSVTQRHAMLCICVLIMCPVPPAAVPQGGSRQDHGRQARGAAGLCDGQHSRQPGVACTAGEDVPALDPSGLHCARPRPHLQVSVCVYTRY